MLLSAEVALRLTSLVSFPPTTSEVRDVVVDSDEDLSQDLVCVGTLFIANGSQPASQHGMSRVKAETNEIGHANVG